MRDVVDTQSPLLTHRASLGGGIQREPPARFWHHGNFGGSGGCWDPVPGEVSEKDLAGGGELPQG